MKYLITQTQLDTLASLPMSRALAEELDELKPIEPLTTEVITEIWESEAIKGTRFGYSPFARAIERHILGEIP